MSYVRQPMQIRRNIQIYKRGLRYKVIGARFTEEGKLDFKDYFESHFPHRVRRFIIDILHEDAFDGLTSKEIEVYNFTQLNLKLGVIKIHELG